LVSSRSHLEHVSQSGLRAKYEYLRDQIVPVLALLETTECHLCSRNVFLRVL
jgi:hypothetical protein